MFLSFSKLSNEIPINRVLSLNTSSLKVRYETINIKIIINDFFPISKSTKKSRKTTLNGILYIK